MKIKEQESAHPKYFLGYLKHNELRIEKHNQIKEINSIHRLLFTISDRHEERYRTVSIV